MSDDLRTLAQAVADADCPDHAGGARKRRFARARLALYAALPNPVDGACAILAALDAVDAAADARGYARAMGEVESAMDAASDEALAEYQARRSDYRDGFCDGLCEAYRIAQNTAKAARE